MSLEEQVMTQMKDAMKAKDEALLRGLRAIKAEIIKAKTEPGANGQVSEEGEAKLLQKLVKQRKDSLDIYQQQNRADLAQKESEEIAVIEKFLPQQLADQELKAILKNIIASVGAAGPQDMGKVMGIATKQLAGQAEGKAISAAVKELLSDMLIDSIFLLLMVWAIIKGLRHGLVVAAFSFLSIFIGLAAAIKLSAVVAGRLRESTQLTATWIPFISFALIILAVMLLVRFAAKLIETAMKAAFLGWANKLGGVLLYAALYLTIFSVLLFFSVQTHLLNNNSTAASKTYRFIQPIGPRAIDAFGSGVPLFKGIFDQLSQFFEEAAKKAA